MAFFWRVVNLTGPKAVPRAYAITTLCIRRPESTVLTMEDKRAKTIASALESTWGGRACFRALASTKATAGTGDSVEASQQAEKGERRSNAGRGKSA